MATNTSANDGFPKDLEGHRAKMIELYENGTPMFTKDVLRSIDFQFDNKSEDGEEILIRCLDGSHAKFMVQKASGRPYLGYNTIQSMVTKGDLLPKPYCSFNIEYGRLKKNRISGKLEQPEGPVRYDEIKAVLDHISQYWELEDDSEQLRSLLDSVNIPGDVNKIVAFGLGPIRPVWLEGSEELDLGEPDHCRSAFYHALVLTLQSIFIKSEPEIRLPPCYLQDPDYCDTDKSLLADSGLTVVDDPKAFLQLDDSSILVSASPQMAVKQVLTDIARPAMIIWFDAPEEDDGNIIVSRPLWDPIWDPSSPRVRQMIENEYRRYDFPSGEMTFRDLAIYVRR